MSNQERSKKVSFPPYRKIGTTTRIVDGIVQRLFIEGEAEIYDHHHARASADRVLGIVMHRLEREHDLRSVPNNANRPFIMISNEHMSGAMIIKLMIVTNKLIEYDG